MADNWTKLKWRLQAVANNEAAGGAGGIALIHVNVFLVNGLPVMWHRPQRIPLEPQNANIGILPLVRGEGWDGVMRCMVNGQKQGMIDKTLMVKDGKPLGWLE